MDIDDPILRDAVAAIDAGDVAALDALLSANPYLLINRIANGEDGYFAAPYLLWFVVENPIRNERLPPNIVEVANTIINHLDRLAPPSRQHQLDYTVELAATGRVPRECGVQTRADRCAGRAWRSRLRARHNRCRIGERDAARRLIHHGAPLTLTAAIGAWPAGRGRAPASVCGCQRARRCAGRRRQPRPARGRRHAARRRRRSQPAQRRACIVTPRPCTKPRSPVTRRYATCSSLPAPHSPSMTSCGTAHPPAGRNTRATRRSRIIRSQSSGPVTSRRCATRDAISVNGFPALTTLHAI